MLMEVSILYLMVEFGRLYVSPGKSQERHGHIPHATRPVGAYNTFYLCHFCPFRGASRRMGYFGTTQFSSEQTRQRGGNPCIVDESI